MLLAKQYSKTSSVSCAVKSWQISIRRTFSQSSSHQSVSLSADCLSFFPSHRVLKKQSCAERWDEPKAVFRNGLRDMSLTVLCHLCKLHSNHTAGGMKALTSYRFRLYDRVDSLLCHIFLESIQSQRRCMKMPHPESYRQQSLKGYQVVSEKSCA